MTHFLLLIFLFIQSSLAKVVLIDPGHGGQETGAIGKIRSNSPERFFEKDLALNFSQRLKKELSKLTTTYLTRSLDRTVTLQERAELADLVKADLFLSIHFNSSANSKHHGFELYYLDNNSNVANAKVEKAENQDLKGEELIVNQILVDLVVQQTVKYSKKLAELVHQSVKPNLKKYKIEDRGIKAGLFYVLALSKRPGLLIEIGFMSNPEELKKIQNEKFLNDLAQKIAEGVFRYIKTQSV
jgi:N-acetylmuramoyl-L-alanine amidase